VIGYSERHRQLVHIALGSGALLLRYATWQQAAMLAVLALLFGAVALRHVAPHIVRPGDVLGPRAGVLFYPASILVLILIFRDRLDIVAVAWAIMAFGDGCATLAGASARAKRLPWNSQKSWRGLLAFILAGGTAAIVLSAWVAPSVDPTVGVWLLVWAPLAAAVVAGFAETLPIGLDDNLVVPATGAAVLWYASQIDRFGPLDLLALDLATGAIVSAPLAVIAWRSRSVTANGAIVGLIIGSVVYASVYLAGLAVLGVALILTLVSSRFRKDDKRQTALARGPHDRRGVGNILANCLVGTAGAALEPLTSVWLPELTSVWFVAGIAAGASDTVASEIGKAFGGRTYVFPSGQRAAPGTPGAVSLTGSVAGVIGAALIVVPALLLWLIPGEFLVPIVVACTCGAFLESALATRFEARGVLDNHALNFINTATAAIIAVLWCAQLTPTG
jgi:uncharacterized protein (TIGR00297 family)